VQAKQFVWSDPEVIELSKHFVMVADEGIALPKKRQHHPLLNGLINQEPEGIFSSANGTVLVDSRRYRTMAERMAVALEVYQGLSRDQRLMPDDYEWPDLDEMRGANAATAPPDFAGCQDDYPSDGLVLHAYYRDLPRADYKHLDRIQGWNRWVRDCWNQDFVWLQREEVLGFLPDCLRTMKLPSPGYRFDVSSSVTTKLARFHMKDLVSGRELTWPKESVKDAYLTAEVTGVMSDRVALRYEGVADLIQDGKWGAATNALTVRRGFKAQLLGYGTYSTQSERFLEFDLIAMGTRWGAGPFNMRKQTDDHDPNPMGIVFTLAGDSPAERIRPGCDYRE
jgi:hypothetical protein